MVVTMVHRQRHLLPDRTVLPALALTLLAVVALALGPHASSQPYLIPNDLMTQETIVMVRLDLNRISVETVKEHVQNILRKIDATDRTQAAVWAVRKKIV